MIRALPCRAIPSFPGDDRAQREAEDHCGAGSDCDTGQDVGQENPVCDTEDGWGHDRQRDMRGRRPRAGDRRTPLNTADVLTEIITRRVTRKSDPRCSIGEVTYRPTAASTIGKRLWLGRFSSRRERADCQFVGFCSRSGLAVSVAYSPHMGTIGCGVSCGECCLKRGRFRWEILSTPAWLEPSSPIADGARGSGHGIFSVVMHMSAPARCCSA